MLQAYVAEKLNQHKQSALRKFGYCTVDVKDRDTIVITRYFTSTDALGRKAPQKDAREEIVIRR